MNLLNEMEELLSDIDMKRNIYPKLYLDGLEDVARAVIRYIKKEDNNSIIHEEAR